MQHSDAELVSRATKGDRRSFDLLVEQHYSLVYNTAYRILGDADSAADATQTAFVRAYRSLGRFRGTSAFSTWLYRIVCNVCLDVLRSTRGNVVSLDATDEEAIGSHHRQLRDHSHEPSFHVEQSERQRAVHKALGLLHEDYRVVLVLCDLQGFSYDEIAQIVQIPLGTVKSRLNRARLALKKALAPDMELFE